MDYSFLQSRMNRELHPAGAKIEPGVVHAPRDATDV